MSSSAPGSRTKSRHFSSRQVSRLCCMHQPVYMSHRAQYRHLICSGLTPTSPRLPAPSRAIYPPVLARRDQDAGARARTTIFLCLSAADSVAGCFPSRILGICRSRHTVRRYDREHRGSRERKISVRRYRLTAEKLFSGSCPPPPHPPNPMRHERQGHANERNGERQDGDKSVGHAPARFR